MAWEESETVAFTRIDVVSRIPSESGVFAVMDQDQCLLVGDTWNLKARLLELANVLDDQRLLTIRYETCPDSERAVRKAAVMCALGHHNPAEPSPDPILPGLSLRDSIHRPA